MKKQKLSVGTDDSVCPKHQRNTQRGITLIALIITIIVLLILAVVSIRLVMNNGILGKAESGVSKYQEAEADEQAQLLQAEYEMAKYEGKATGTFTDYVLETKYNGAKIGDYVAYNEAGFGDYTTDTSKGIGGSVGDKDSTTGKYPLIEKTYTTENLGWRVLGVNEKGELELISDNPTTDTVTLANEEAYLYGAEELNIMCNTLYGNGTDGNGKVVATGARSLNLDDIDKLAGITTEEQKKAVSSSYGTLLQYQFPEGGTYMQYRKSTDNGETWTDWADITGSNYQTFRMPGADSSTTISSTNPGISETLKCTYYNYTISNYVKKTTSDGKSMADIITKGTGTSILYQWLASTTFRFYGGEAIYFYVLGVGGGDSAGCMVNLCDSYGSSSNLALRARPVVSLKSNIQLSGSSESGWTIN